MNFLTIMKRITIMLEILLTLPIVKTVFTEMEILSYHSVSLGMIPHSKPQLRNFCPPRQKCHYFSKVFCVQSLCFCQYERNR